MKVGSFRLSKKSGMALIIAIMLVTVIVAVQISQHIDRAGNTSNNSIERSSTESREASVKRFRLSFVDLALMPKVMSMLLK